MTRPGWTRRRAGVGLASALLAPGCATSMRHASDPKETLQALVEPRPSAPDWSDPFGPLMGVALVVVDDVTAPERDYAAGWARAGVAEMNADAPMRMASVSKLVCAMGALRLAERGLVDLDADASKALGFRARNPAFPDVPITLRRLLSHTSSLRDGERYWANHPETLSVLFEGAHAQERWGREPPGYFTYCNLNYGLVGQAMEAAAGERFDLLMRRLVFDPLGLACGYNWSGVPRERRAAAAALYRKTGPDGETLDPNGVWTPQIDATAETLDPPTYRSKPNAPDLAAYRLGANGSLFAPQGGLRASVRDLARIGGDLLRALAGQGRAASAEMVARLSDPVWRFDGANGATEGGFYRAFGAGGHILDQGVFGHFGEAYGLRSGLLIDPRRRRVCAYAINGFSREPPPGIAPAERDLIAAAGFAHALG